MCVHELMMLLRLRRRSAAFLGSLLSQSLPYLIISSENDYASIFKWSANLCKSVQFCTKINDNNQRFYETLWYCIIRIVKVVQVSCKSKQDCESIWKSFSSFRIKSISSQQNKILEPPFLIYFLTLFCLNFLAFLLCVCLTLQELL